MVAEIAGEIVNQESDYCNFDTLGFMIIYPEYDVSKFETGDGILIYQIIDRNSNKEFTFAIRGCVLPPGM